jgi:hypothetical protein
MNKKETTLTHESRAKELVEEFTNSTLYGLSYGTRDQLAKFLEKLISEVERETLKTEIQNEGLWLLIQDAWSGWVKGDDVSGPMNRLGEALRERALAKSGDTQPDETTHCCDRCGYKMDVPESIASGRCLYCRAKKIKGSET